MQGERKRKNIPLHLAPILVLVSALVGLGLETGKPALAQDDLFVYPKEGQSDEQQRKDRYECHMWAVQQTGFDPTVPQQAPQSKASGGQALRGAAGGAALGAIGGAIGGNAGKGAAIGAGVGGTAGAIRRAQERERNAERQKQWEANQQNQRAQYNRALSTCLEGRNYTVK